jgi:hypothetical protein
MKPLVITVAILVGVSVSLIVLFLVAYFGEFPLPVGSDQFRSDWKFKSLVTQGDQIIGGGYSFAEARDIWIRIRLRHKPDLKTVSVGSACPPEIAEKLRTWFLQQATDPKLYGVLPLPKEAEADKAALNDPANLSCRSTEQYTPVLHQFGEAPKGCSVSWVLYHAPSRFYYERSPCSH